jgi:Fic family protein
MEKTYPLLDQANIALGRLDGLSIILPDPSLYLYMYIRKEAVLSSQIEGTQSSLSDLLLFENEEIAGVLNKDVIEVSNYVAAMEHGLKRIQGGFPLSLRLIREMHEILLNRGRGSFKQPGEFRRSQNWIGGTRPGNAKFVPPPPEKLMDLLDELEKFLHDETVKLPTLVKAALAHHQFETIHPFLDGNGRLGRLLITFVLCVDGIMHEPMLYLSLYFKTHRQAYYDHLQLVRETGDWEEWLQFFLKGVIVTANQAVTTAQTILNLFTGDRKKIEATGKPAASALIVHHYLQKHPTIDSKKIVENCNLSLPTTIKSLNHLTELGIVKEITGKARNKIYVYHKYLDILNEGTAPIQELL